MILIESSFDLVYIGSVLCGLIPRQLQNVVKIVAYNKRFLRRLGHSVEPVCLFQKLSPYFFRKVELHYSFGVLVYLVLILLVLTKLARYSFHLLAQIILTLAIVYLIAYPRLYVSFYVQYFDLAGYHCQKHTKARNYVTFLKKHFFIFNC